MGLFKRVNARKGVVGVAFREDAVSIAQVRRGASGARLRLCDVRPVAPAETHAAVLNELVREHGLKGAPCVGVLAQGCYQLLQVEPPEVAAEELRQALRWRVRELIDFPVEQAVIDAFPPPGDTPRRVGKLNAVVCRASEVADKAAALRESGLVVRALDIVELAQRNLLAELPESETGVALLSFDEAGGLITLVKGRELYLARDLEIGLRHLAPPEPGANEAPQAYDAVLLELQRTLDYYESSYAMPGIGRLLVHPDDAQLQTLVDHLDRNLAAEVRTLDLARAGQLAPAGGLACLTALGAALRQEGAGA